MKEEKQLLMFWDFFFSWINIKSHSKLWSECFWAFPTSRKLPTFHSTCQLPQSVWTGNLLLRLSYLLLSYCQGCLGNENHCEVTYGCFFLFFSFKVLHNSLNANKNNIRSWRSVCRGIKVGAKGTIQMQRLRGELDSFCCLCGCVREPVCRGLYTVQNYTIWRWKDIAYSPFNLVHPTIWKINVGFNVPQNICARIVEENIYFEGLLFC